MIERIKELLSLEAAAVKNIPVSESYQKAVEIIYRQVHIKKGKLISSGMGKAGQIAQNIATTFSSTGTPSVFLHPSDAQHGDLGVIQENDVLLLISNSGKTREILEIVSLSGKLYDLPLIVITGNPKGELADQADVILQTGIPKRSVLSGLLRLLQQQP